ncbi:hypothetical protein [Collinsella sp. An2]|uniref:hypothetical protein n=1 Tax=Collinsella sp. An2 TaxID=1965585 RepID=UPI000B372FAF|nr:hypothetical protein [Collinsella sp. An2]OUP08002.1 hypothetical protein B5F33_07670 [Collinsella sp. An2]
MKTSERRALEAALRNHYRSDSASKDEVPGAAPRALVKAVAAELSRPTRPGFAEVLASQARYIGVGPWVLHAALVAAAVPSTLSGIGPGTVTAVLGSTLALATLIGITRTRSCGMAELEAACPVNSQATTCARALVLSCFDALAITLLAVGAGHASAPWLVFAQGLAPYLGALGAGLLAARRVATPDATAAAAAAAGLVVATCILARTACPSAFGSAATLAWWAAAAGALAFAAAEARAWLRASTSGFVETAVMAAR